MFKSMLSGLSAPVLFFKATSKKQVWIPQYVKKDGTVVVGHMAMVHVSSDHSHAKVAAGQGTYTQKQAHAALSKVPGFTDKPIDDQAAAIMHYATELQDKASSAAVLSTFKKKVLAGQNPTPAEWKAFDAAPEGKKAEIIAEAAKAGVDSAMFEAHGKLKGESAPAKAAPSLAPAPKVETVAAVAPAAPIVPAAPEKGQIPAVADALSAIEAAKLPESNSNHKPVNSKLADLAKLVEGADVKGILGMSFGTNTYGQKVAKLANQALSALGSTHQVVSGQKAGTHAALSSVASAPAVAPAPKATEKPAAPAKPAPAAAPAPKPKNDRSDWKYVASDPGMSGLPTVTTPLDGGGEAVLINAGMDGYEIALIDKNGDLTNEGEHIFPTLPDAVEAMQELGIPPVPSDVMAQFAPLYKKSPKIVAASQTVKPAVKAPAPAPAPAKPAASAKKYSVPTYENTSDGHSKFWSAHIEGTTLVTTHGKIGTKGVQTVKPMASLEAAHAAMDKAIDQKKKKGYYYAGSKEVSAATGSDDSPKNGDTKPAADGGTLVFMDGHWHKQNSAPAAANASPKVVSVAANSDAGDQVTTIDGWVKVGEQKGYNPGGTFKDENGQEWYCKFPSGGVNVAKNELLASKLYALAGVKATECKLVSQNGKVGVASKILSNVKQDKAALLEGKADGLLSGFAVDAWLANWDAVGNNPSKGYDNILIASDGSAVRIDAGGALQYGGAGGKKQTFGNEVIELKTMLDPAKNAHTAAVFGKMSQADIAASVKKVAAISDDDIMALAMKHGPGSPSQREYLGKLLIARKADMLKQYPSAAAPVKKAKVSASKSGKSGKSKKPIVFDPSKLGQAPDFLNWKGAGQSGPASLHEKNVANQEAVNQLLDVAKSGSIEAIKSMKMPFYDASGNVTHHVSPLEHPSQYVKGFAQQLINEIDVQLNPPKPFRWTGHSPLEAMDKAYPKIKNITAAGLNKLGYYLKLGKPGVLSAEEAAIHNKLSWKNGKLTKATYSAAAKAVTSKLPKQQRDALRSYTGSGYKQINHSLWAGNPDGAAKSAEEALMTLGHEITAGTILSRKINLKDGDLAELNQSVGTILQEPAVMSTSLRPDCWSGNVHFKITVGHGVKGLYVGPGSLEKGGALSMHASEDELLLPPNTRMLVQSVKTTLGATIADPDGFGDGCAYIVEVLILPTI